MDRQEHLVRSVEQSTMFRGLLAAFLIWHVWSWTGLFYYWLAVTVLGALATFVLKRSGELPKWA